jgi:hypothetical protein
VCCCVCVWGRPRPRDWLWGGTRGRMWGSSSALICALNTLNNLNPLSKSQGIRKTRKKWKQNEKSLFCTFSFVPYFIVRYRNPPPPSGLTSLSIPYGVCAVWPLGDFGFYSRLLSTSPYWAMRTKSWKGFFFFSFLRKWNESTSRFVETIHLRKRARLILSDTFHQIRHTQFD